MVVAVVVVVVVVVVGAAVVVVVPKMTPPMPNKEKKIGKIFLNFAIIDFNDSKEILISNFSLML